MKHFRSRKMRSGITYYYFDGTKPETPLGSDYTLAVKKWVELTQQPATVVTTFIELAERYEREVLPLKAKSTQATQRSDLKHLRAFFCGPPPAPLDSIRPKHIGQLLDGKRESPQTANRLKRLFSHMFNTARRWGYTDRENPVIGVEGFAIGKRTVDVSEAVYKAVWAAGSAVLQDAMDLAYLTGQRPGDVLKFNERQIIDGVFVIRQSKTAAPLRIRIEGAFGDLIERIKQRKAARKVWCASLATNAHGMTLSAAVLRTHFVEAREAAALANPALAEDIRKMWFYDLRAKAADDTAADQGDQAAANLLGHSSVSTTQRHYLRRGKTVGPTR